VKDGRGLLVNDAIGTGDSSLEAPFNRDRGRRM
jgi:hypothetical protein